MSTLKRRLRHEAGFTMIELMVTMVLGLLIAFAVLTTFENFTSNASRQTRVTDANNQVRNIMDRVVSDLRQAATVEVADPNDLVYTVADSPSQVRRERICLDSSGYVWRASVRTAAPPVTPISAGTACPTSGTGAVHITNLLSRNSVSNPIFRYDTATATNVRTVGMTFTLDAGNTGHNDTSTLRASAFRRAKAERAPTTSDSDITTTCGSAGPLLTLSASLGSASVTYATIDGTSLGTASAGTSLQLPATATSIVARITTAVGGVTEVQKDLAC